MRSKGCPINTSIVMATALGIVKNHDSNLLSTHGSHIDINKHWGKNFLVRLGYVKRRANTKSKVTDENFELMKSQFLFDIRTIVEMEDIPEDLVINWDHTGLNYVPVSNWTMANEETTLAYIDKILVPYLTQKRQQLSLDTQHPALVIFDRFKGQCTSHVLDSLRKNNIHIVVVPANCTDRLQPLDVSLNKSAKEFLRRKFQEWYAEQVRSQLQKQEEPSNVDLKLSVIKPLGAAWLMELYDFFKINSDIIKNGFKGAGITSDSCK